MIKSNEYLISSSTIIFEPEFYKPIEKFYSKIAKCSKLIFSNYKILELSFETSNKFLYAHENLWSPSKFNCEINCEIINLPNLYGIIFGHSFDKSVNNLPSKLFDLYFGYKFNQNVDNLPSDLIIIVFGYQFNNPVSNLPIKLKYLVFGNKFNCRVDSLPESVESITFGNNFDYPINNLPNHLKELKFNIFGKYNHVIESLPSELEYLQLNCIYEHKIIKISKLKTIVCDSEYPYIQNLKKLGCNIIIIK